MSDQTIYLDTSAIVKRYVIEEETDRIDKIYEKAHAGKIRLMLENAPTFACIDKQLMTNLGL